MAHPHRRRIERALGAEPFQRVARAPQGPIGACRSTVGMKVISHGGEIVCGWLAHIWPGRFIEAVFHCVWRSPKGRLLDLTSPYPTDPAPFSTFALTPGTPFCADLPSRYWVLTDAPEVSELLTLVEQEIEVRRRAEAGIAGRMVGVALRASLLGYGTPEELAEVHQLERGIASAMERCRGLSIRSPRRR